VSVSSSPPPHGPETYLFESCRHSSSQSGTPSLSVSVSTSNQPRLPPRVFAESWGYSSPQSVTSLLSESIILSTSPQPHRPGTVFSIIFGQSSLQSRLHRYWSPSRCLLFDSHTPRAPSFHSLEGIRRRNRGPVAIRVCFCFSTVTFACQSLCRVLGPFVTIGNLVAIGICLYFSTATFAGTSSLSESVFTSPQPHSLFCRRLRRPFQWVELFVI
jgi:hypothetical protein